MDQKSNSIITEDGQRLTIENGEITGTEDPGPGLAYEKGNTLLNENNNSSEENKTKNSCKKQESNETSQKGYSPPDM